MNKNRSPHSPKPGFVLLIVLVTVIALSLAAWSFSLLMVAEDQVTRLAGRQVQSRYLVESGVDFTRMMLSYDDATIKEMGGIWNNPGQFQGIAVSINPMRPEEIGRFSIVAPGLDTDGNLEGMRFGLVDESSKLNVNTLIHADGWLPGGGRQLLMSLPLMTEEVADAILDWMDDDDDIREYGAEFSYYAGMSPAYAPKNGPMDSIEELLLVRGVTPQLLFGLDNNHNSVLDIDEQYSGDAGSIPPEMQLGWCNYLTLFSKESNLNPSGLERININSEDLAQLYDDLRSVFDEEWTNFIIAYRQNGPFTGETPEDQEEGFVDVDVTKAAEHTFSQVIDLINARTKADAQNSDGETVSIVIDSPVNELNMGRTIPLLMENLTTVSGDNIPGRINIMQTSRQILLGVPGMTEEVAERIIQLREQELGDPGLADNYRRYETWILVQGIVDLATMKAMTPFICADGDVYRAEVVGYFQDSVATSRAEVIFDATLPIPRLLFWRDKSHLQSGYSVDQLGAEYQSP